MVSAWTMCGKEESLLHPNGGIYKSNTRCKFGMDGYQDALSIESIICRALVVVERILGFYLMGSPGTSEKRWRCPDWESGILPVFRFL